MLPAFIERFQYGRSPEWKIHLYFEENIVNISQMSGGVTNIIYKVVTDKNKYILRIYGKESDLIIDRENERIIMNYYDL